MTESAFRSFKLSFDKRADHIIVRMSGRRVTSDRFVTQASFEATIDQPAELR